jgi:hypothetical protein
VLCGAGLLYSVAATSSIVFRNNTIQTPGKAALARKFQN